MFKQCSNSIRPSKEKQCTFRKRECLNSRKNPLKTKLKLHATTNKLEGRRQSNKNKQNNMIRREKTLLKVVCER